MSAQGDAARPAVPVVNTSAGTVHGPSVQAGAVHGGITFNYRFGYAAEFAGQRPDGVPRPPRWFVNRLHALAELDGLFGDGDAPDCPIGVFSGLPGIGKTAAACQWAHRNRHRFPDGQLFVDFAALRAGAGADVSEALAMCLRALGVRDSFMPTGLADRTTLYRTLSADRRLLVVLDDVSRPAQVSALVPQGTGSAVLATSTWRLGELALDGAALLPLDVLDAPSAMDLLTALCGRQRIADEPDAATRLSALCGGLPIALRITAAKLLMHRRLTMRALVEELSDEQSRLSRISVTSAREERTVSAALELAYRDLPEPVARLYRVLGCLPGRSFDTALAAVAAELGRKEAQRHLDVLDEASLLTVTPDVRYRMHDLVRLHAVGAARETEPPGTEREVVRRSVGHYLALAAMADLTVRADRLRIAETAEILGPGRGRGGRDTAGPFAQAEDPGRDAISWLEAERPNILAVLRAALRCGFDRQVWQLAEVFTVLFLHHRHLADWRESLDLGAQAAGRDGQAAAEARLRSLLSRPLLDLGHDEQAYTELARAERLAVESGNLVLQASVQEFLGRYWDRHDPSLAIAAYRTSLALNAEARENRGEALARYFLGCAHSAAGDHDIALEALSAARTAFVALADGRMAARALADIGRARSRLGDRAGAASALGDAADGLRRHHAFHYEAQALEDLADLLDDPDEIRPCLQRALAVYEEGGSPRAEEVRARLVR
ncbi:ATP-binding protein [Streptomyces sp. NPDC018045]|uniref:ATP-binding protein n=1 Tax=Streptomyces sp. NPDC018045 TaxID=3365037 RepID=UPI003787DB12